LQGKLVKLDLAFEDYLAFAKWPTNTYFPSKAKQKYRIISIT
jgi:hypothetical protein